MTTPPTLPTLPGLTWSRHKKPGFNTRVASHVSGREVRVPLMNYPIYEFEAKYSALTSSATGFAGLLANSQQTLMGFFIQLQGQFGTFLFPDPDEGAVTGGAIGTGDGTTTTFTLTRIVSGYAVPVDWVLGVTNVYLNGAALPSSNFYSLSGNTIIFNRAPAPGVAITADFTWAFLCRFDEDTMDFEEFMSALWRLDSVKFRSVKNSLPATLPAWMISPEGNVPLVYADFVNGLYWYNGQSYSTFATWLTAVGGSFTRPNPSPFSGQLYTGSNGFLQSAAVNVPRFDYDTAGNPVGLLLEPSFSNGILYSQAFSNAAWTKTNVSAADNSVRAPDSTTTGSLITESGSGSQAHEISQSVTSPNLVVISIYARAGTGNYLNIAASTSTTNQYAQAIFDLSQGGVTECSVGPYASTDDSGIAYAFAEPAPDFGDGWYRCVFRFIFTNNPSAITFHFGIAAAAHGNTYSSSGQELHASGGKTIYLWGAQAPTSPEVPLSYAATTSAEANGGGDVFYIGASWDNAANPLTFLSEYDGRGLPTFGGNTVIADGYYGTNSDSWYVSNPPQTQGVQQPSGNTANTFTGQLPGVNADAIRVDSTIVTIADNGNPTVASTAGTARTAATKIALGSYEAVVAGAPLRLRRIAAWSTSITNATLPALSATPGMPVPTLASTIDSGDANWVGWPGFCVMPSGYLLATYVRYNSAAQGALPSQVMYRTAPNAAGPWSSAAVAVANSNGAIDVAIMPLVTLPGGTILGIVNPANYTSPYTQGLGTLQSVTGSENAGHSVTWSSPTTITGSPFFGTDAAGTLKGDLSVAPPILLPNGKWMLLLYGYQAGASVTSTGAIFSTTPSNPASWGSFTIIANGAAFSPVLAFSEAGCFIDASNNIVVILRQDVGAPGLQVPSTSYWRVMCPAGADPTVAANWKAPTLLSFDNTVGMPDVVGLGNNGMWMMTRGGVGSNQLVGYNVNWNAAKSPFPGNRMSLLNPTFYNRQYWYSQSQLLTPSTVGTALAADSPVGIYFIESPFVGVGQSQ